MAHVSPLTPSSVCAVLGCYLVNRKGDRWKSGAWSAFHEWI